MDRTAHNMTCLFDQLGVASDAASIAGFIATHRPIPGAQRLHEAAFWSPMQARFLSEACLEDAEWSGVVDKLNAEMHG